LDDKPFVNNLKACGCLQGILLNSINSFNETLLAKWFKKEQLLNAFNILCKHANDINITKIWEYYSQNSNQFQCKNCCIDSIADAEQSNISSDESLTGATQVEMFMTKLPFSALDRIIVALGNYHTRIMRTNSFSYPNEVEDGVLQNILNNSTSLEYLLECYMKADEWTDWEVPLQQTVASIIKNISFLIPIRKLQRQSTTKNKCNEKTDVNTNTNTSRSRTIPDKTQNPMAISNEIFYAMMSHLVEKQKKNHDAALQAKCSDLWQSLLRIRLRLSHPYDWHHMIIIPEKSKNPHKLFALLYISDGIMRDDTPDEHYDRGWTCLAILLEEISNCLKVYPVDDLKYKQVSDVLLKLTKEQLIYLTVLSPLKDKEGMTCYYPHKAKLFLEQEHVTAAAHALSCCSRVCFPINSLYFESVNEKVRYFSENKRPSVPCTQFCIMLIDIFLGWPNRTEVFRQGPPTLVPIHRHFQSKNQRNNGNFDDLEDEEQSKWEENGIFSLVNHNLTIEDSIKMLSMLSRSVGVLSHHGASPDCQAYIEACIWSWQRVILALVEHIMKICRNSAPSNNERVFELTLNMDNEEEEVLNEVEDKQWIFDTFEQIMGIVARDFAYDDPSTYRWRAYQLDSIWWLMHRLSTFGAILNKEKQMVMLPCISRSGFPLVGDQQHLELLLAGHDNHASCTALAMTVLFLMQLEQTTNDNNDECEELVQLCLSAVEAVVHAILMTHQFSILQWLRKELLYNYYTKDTPVEDANDRLLVDPSNPPSITVCMFTDGPALSSPLLPPYAPTTSPTIRSTKASSSSEPGLAGRLVTKLLLRVSARMLEQVYDAINHSVPNSTASSQLEIQMQRASQRFFSGEESCEVLESMNLNKKMESHLFDFVALPLYAMARALPSSEAFNLSPLKPTSTSGSAVTQPNETDCGDWWCSVLKRWIEYVILTSSSSSPLTSHSVGKRSTLQGWVTLPYALPFKEAASAVDVYVPLLGHGIDTLNDALKKKSEIIASEGNEVINHMVREMRVLLGVMTLILAKSVEASLTSLGESSDTLLKNKRGSADNYDREQEGERSKDNIATNVCRHIGEMCLVQEWLNGDVVNRPLLHQVVGAFSCYFKELLEDQVHLQRRELSSRSSSTKFVELTSISSSLSAVDNVISEFRFMLTGLLELELHLLDIFPILNASDITVISTLPEEQIADGIYVENKSRTIKCLTEILDVAGNTQLQLGDKRWQLMIREIHHAVSEHLHALGKRQRFSCADDWRSRQKEECRMLLHLEPFLVLHNTSGQEEPTVMVNIADDPNNRSQVQAVMDDVDSMIPEKMGEDKPLGHANTITMTLNKVASLEAEATTATSVDVHILTNRIHLLMRQLLERIEQLNQCPESDEKRKMEEILLDFADVVATKIDPSQHESQHGSAATQE